MVEVDEAKSLVGFRVLVAEADDVGVISGLSWWTLKNMLSVVGMLVVVVVIVAGWGIYPSGSVFCVRRELSLIWKSVFEAFERVVIYWDSRLSHEIRRRGGRRSCRWRRFRRN